MKSVYSCIFINISILISSFDKNIFTSATQVCKRDKTINKCCPEGTYVISDNFACSVPNKSSSVKINFSSIPLYDKNKRKIGKNLSCVYTLVPGIMLNNEFNISTYDYSDLGHKHYLSEEGKLYEEDPNQYVYWSELSTEKFCIDYKLDSNLHISSQPTFWTILGSANYISSQTSLVYIIGLFISCFFLVVVLLVFCLLPGPRMLSELVQMAYVGSTFAGFLFLAIIMLNTYSRITCLCLSYATYFFLLASFCWMAVMSYDLWRLHSITINLTANKRKIRSRFLSYSVCAWGVPGIMTIFLMSMNHAKLDHIPSFIKPNIPDYGCFIAGGEKLLYFYIPMMILIISNWVFFILTSYCLWKQYKDSSAVDKNSSSVKQHRSFKNRFLMYLKLSIIMGISWILEFISSLKPDLHFWYITDFYNILMGFSMFLIFVCNKKTKNKLMKRFKNSASFKKDSVETEHI